MDTDSRQSDEEVIERVMRNLQIIARAMTPPMERDMTIDPNALEAALTKARQLDALTGTAEIVRAAILAYESAKPAKAEHAPTPEVTKFLQETFIRVPLGTGSVVIGRGTLDGSAAVFFEAVAVPRRVGADATNSETGLAENRIAPGSVVITFGNIESAHVLLEAIEDRIQAMSISQQGEDR